jgi:Kef-type K+ transport system membrane component KefB
MIGLRQVKCGRNTQMKEKTIKLILTSAMFMGLALVALAIYLAAFAELQNEMGMTGIKIIAAVAGCGLILLLPSKIFLTLWLMMNKGS